MRRVDWEQVQVSGFPVPRDAPLSDLTAELTEMLGNPDPRLREDVALATLRTWIRRGVYDDLLRGLGDGMATGLMSGIGDARSASVFRRSCSAMVLGYCITRDRMERRLPGWKVLEWGDRLAAWLLAERDRRGYVPGQGWAHAVARGADAIGALARHPHCGAPELTVLLDVICDRVSTCDDHAWIHGESDRLARATLQILRRDLVPTDVIEAWLDRVGELVDPAVEGPEDPLALTDPAVGAANAAAYLRALYIQLALAPDQPRCRADVLLLVVDQLRTAHPDYLTSRSSAVVPRP
jgi:hypothetical protein